MIKLIVVMGLIVLCAPCLQLASYWRRTRRRRRILRVVSAADAIQYEGKHVMLDGYRGPVVAFGETPEEVLAEVSSMDSDILDRLVSIYIPRRGERLVGGQYISPAK